MNSNMLAGERRWASARRGGMTVLGKVAAPKPLNLPSQRLENHGLDPNVEIVPKGTLGWGSRPSSSGSNPWVSSSQPPNVEGGTVSPSHIGGRPSSAGSGTRPSTAGSERTHEPVSGGTWGSNSRPSSASGTLSSNKTSSASLRPSSAENRPNSSQSHLSRFADPMSKNSAAWTPNVPGERMGTKSSKEDGFSLTSGDFPTLGTEKDNSMKITELEGHGRPSSASGRIAHGNDDTRDQTDAKHGTVNTWRAGCPQTPEDDNNPSIEKWHGDNPQYFNPNAPPHHFDSWCGPPMSGPSGVWYGARPRGPLPFGSHGGPGRFPMEPFPYYRPQIAPLPLGSSQPGTRGSHPKNGDLYRPQMPDAAYAPRPGMPHRPGFYPGSPGPIAFESFYGPPMGYERDIPYMGMAAPPNVYNNSYPGSSQSRDGNVRHAGKASLEQVEAKDSHGPKRITLKCRNRRDQLEDGETQEHNLPQSEVSYPEKKFLPIISSRKNEWGAEEDPEEDLHPQKTLGEYRVHSSDGVKAKSFEGMSNTKAVNDNSKKLPENVLHLPLEMARVPLGSVRDSSLPDVMNNSALMHKIDGMNAKIRIYDGRNDSIGAYNREEVRNESQMIDTKTNNSTGDLSNTAGSFERTPASRDFVSVPHGVAASVSNKPKQPMIVVSSRPHHGGQVRVEHRGKGKFSSQDADAWRKKSLSTESSSGVTASHIEYPTDSHAHIPATNVEGDSVETHDSIGIQAQRTKMREIVKQRSLQLQKEEEERTKEQRAKALAKLEELNRRTLAGEDGSEKAENTQATNAIQGEQNESLVIDGPSMGDHHTNTNQAGEAAEKMPRNLSSEPDPSTNLPVQEDSHDGSVRKSAPQYNDSKHKRVGYKQKQNSSLQKSFAEKQVPNVASDEHRLSSETKLSESSSKLKQNSSLQKSFTEKHVPNVAANNDITSGKPYPSSEPKLSESNMPNASDTVVEGVVSQRRKSNRGTKSKQKPDESPLPLLESSIDHTKESIENADTKDSSSVSTVIEPEHSKAVKAQKVLSSSLPNEESNSSKVSSQWRSHSSRKINNKPNSGGDTAVWAPVNKAKVPTETSSDTVPESSNFSKGNNNVLKGKRAEMERYVPKPAKELSQQDYTPDASVTSGGEVDKHRKDQVVWKQRGPHVESQSVKSDFDPVKTSVKDPDKGKGNMTKGYNNTKADHETDANRSIGSKENQTSSHWQPKSGNQHGNRSESLTAEGNRFPKKGGNFNQTPGELTQEDVHLDGNILTRNNRQNNRSVRGHESRPLNAAPFRDNRQRPKQHYEYQHAANRHVGFEESNDASGSTGQSHRGRGHRRGGGNFHRRQSEVAPANQE